MSNKTPEQFGKYRTLGVLGRGGMATVYLAQEPPPIGRKVAVKVPHIDGDRRAEIVERFMREARLSAKISHPNLCKIYAFDELPDGTPYLVLEYIEGELLSKAMSSRRWEPALAIRLVQRLAGVMQTLHRNGVLHRDLKPSNIIVKLNGEPVIMDFGLARSLGGNSEALTSLHTTLGTPAYMAPEQIDIQHSAEGKQTPPTPAIDVYSLGVILYELLTGKRPFMGQTLAALYGRILCAQPLPPSALRPGLSAALDAICLKTLEKKPEARFPTMTAFAIELGKPGVADYVTPPGGAGEDEQPPSEEPSDDSVSWYGEKAAQGDPTISKPSRPPPLPEGEAEGVREMAESTPPLAELSIDTVADVELQPQQARALSVRVTRSNCNEPIELSLEGLPPGLRSGFGLIPTGHDHGNLTVTAGSDVRPGPVQAQLLAVTTDARAEAAVRIIVKFPPPVPEFMNSLGMRFVLVQPGSFFMGSPEEESMRYPDEIQHAVEISRPFYIATCPVTQADFELLMEVNPSWFSPKGKGAKIIRSKDTQRHPVESVTWDEAVDFCRRLSDYPEEKSQGRAYRLPTEAEWEFACRGGSLFGEPSPFCFSRPRYQLSSREANFDGRFPYGAERVGPFLQQTTPVGSFPPNALGIHDMHGNVWEWCLDWYDEYVQASEVQRDPLGAVDGVERVVRGGSWYTEGQDCRAANRNHLGPQRRCDDVGFRLVLPVPGYAG